MLRQPENNCVHGPILQSTRAFNSGAKELKTMVDMNYV